MFRPVINNSSTPQPVNNCELTPNESLNIRCILDEREANTVKAVSFWDRLKTNLSSFCVKSINELASDVLQMNFASNFLIRNEAKYFPFTQQNITNEDMSNVMNANNKHMTLCINWRAAVSDNGTIVRMALGQHFVQVDHLFESWVFLFDFSWWKSVEIYGKYSSDSSVHFGEKFQLSARRKNLSAFTTIKSIWRRTRDSRLTNGRKAMREFSKITQKYSFTIFKFP